MYFWRKNIGFSGIFWIFGNILDFLISFRFSDFPKFLHFFDNTLSENTLFKNTLSENILSENTILENTLLENTLSENTLSENTLSEAQFEKVW